MDGFEKLVRLGLKEVQEREVVHVLVDCCLQERAYNPYYAYLAHKLCQFNKSHQVCVYACMRRERERSFTCCWCVCR